MPGFEVPAIYGVAGAVALAIFAGFGIVGWRLARGTMEGFMVMDRQANWLMLAGTYIATWISAGTFIGAFALAYNQGFGRVLWNYGSLFGIAFFVFLIGIPLRRMRLVTVPDFFHYFWNNSWLKGWSTLLLIVAQTAYMIGQALAIGKLFEIIFGLDFAVGTTTFMLIVAAYVLIGGMWAVVLSDTLMFITFATATIIGVPLALQFMGGWDALVNTLPQQHPGVWNWSGTANLPWNWAVGQFLIWFALAAASPYLVNRAFIARSEKDLAKGLAFGGMIAVVFLILLFSVGQGAWLFVPNLQDPDYSGIWFAIEPMPTAVGLLMVAGLIASATSTINTLVITIGQAFGRDIYQRFVNTRATEGQVVAATRLGIVLAIVSTLVGALLRPDFVIFVLQWGAAIFLCTYLVGFLMSLYWRGATGKGVLAGMVVGGVLFPVLSLVQNAIGGEMPFVLTYGLQPVLYATIAAVLVTWVVSLVTKNTPDEERHSNTYRRIAFPTGKVFAMMGKTTGSDFAWMYVIFGINVLFIAWFLFSIFTA